MPNAIYTSIPAAADATQSALHVLVVDDEPVIREEIVEFLQMEGIRAKAVSNGGSALQRLREDPSIDVMLSDIRMPGMDGLSLAKAAIDLRGEENAIEIVMLTGHATVNDAAASTRLRVIDFLVKPIGFVALKATILHAHACAMARREKWRQSQALEVVYGASIRQVGDLQSLVTQLREELTEPRRARDGGRDAFMAVVSHELRTPLIPIIGLAELIEDVSDSIDPKELKSLAHEISLGGKKLERTMSRITALADLIGGRAEVRLAMCRVDRTVQTMQRLFTTRLAEHGQTLKAVVESTAAINTDCAKLLQLLEEILDNASRFAPKGAMITLSVADEADGVTFRIADTGPGMSPAEIELARRAFHQVDMSFARRVDGLGIGLPIAIRQAALIGGALTIGSEPGRGTTVSLHVPVGSPPAERP